MLPCGGWNLSAFSWMCAPEEAASQINGDQHTSAELGLLLEQHTPTWGAQRQNCHPPECCWSDGAGVGSPVCFKAGSRELLALQAKSQIRVERVRMEGRRALLLHQEGKLANNSPEILPPSWWRQESAQSLASCLAHKAVPPLRSLHEQSGRPGGVLLHTSLLTKLPQTPHSQPQQQMRIPEQDFVLSPQLCTHRFPFLPQLQPH